MRFLITLCLLIGVHSKAWAALENVYGPKTASAGLLRKSTYNYSFTAQNRTNAVLMITNGDGQNIDLKTCSGNFVQKILCAAGNLLVSVKAGLQRPDSVEFSLNGRVIVTSSQLKQTMGSLQVPINLAASNQLTVKLGNLPTQYLSFSIKAEAAPVNRPPLADFIFTPNTGRAPVAVSFNALASLDPDMDALVDYIWDFGDGTITHGGALIDHTYTTGGNYQISLTVIDSKGAQGSISKSIVITSIQPPLAQLSIVSEMPAIAPAMIMFSADGSSDSDGTIRRYLFDFGDGTSTQSTRPEIVHEYTTAGEYTVTLTVISTSGLSSQATVIADVRDPELQPAPMMGRMARGTSISIDSTGLMAHLQGQVVDEQGRALSGVWVSLKEQPQVGRSMSREDGSFDLAINASDDSSQFTLIYERSGYFAIQRSIVVNGVESIEVDSIVMTRPHSEMTTFVANATETQTAVRTLADGRRMIVTMSAGTSASAVRVDGSSRALMALSLRVTEFLSGPARQILSTDDSLDLNISSDEGLALKAVSVQLSQPISIEIDQGDGSFHRLQVNELSLMGL